MARVRNSCEMKIIILKLVRDWNSLATIIMSRNVCIVSGSIRFSVGIAILT